MTDTASEQPVPDEEATMGEQPQNDPVVPPPTETEPETPPTPEAPPAPDTIAWEPQTWYSATAVCMTPGCIQENVILNIGMLYSNNGDPKYIRVVCGSDRACGKDCTILTATKLDPQPIEE